MSDPLPYRLQEILYPHGFSHAGIQKPQPIAPAYVQKYALWLSECCHADMSYLERAQSMEIRFDPSRYMPEARSIIVLAFRYPIDRDCDTRPGLFGKIASYARGMDYHDVLRTKLEEISTRLSEYARKEHQSRIAIDSAPIMEKPLASQTGLGWIGRNSCLIHPVHGSFFFLANLFTTLELEPTSTEISPLCGDCHRCMDACPTGCIRPDHTIDARRCLSYLTIENKGAIPVELREKVGQHLFGCDICQSVCPWNRKANDTLVLPEFQPADESRAWLDLNKILSISTTDFKHQFSGTPLLRAKRIGLIRNACVVLGNIRSDEAAPYLTRLLAEEPEPVIRSHAAWALGRIPSKKARDALSCALQSETDPNIRFEIKNALRSV
jgi:epoxyqueuosine reductase